MRSITCDGTATNFKMYQNLGCRFNFFYNSFKSHFTHPSSSNIRVHCIMDACHRLKLARNCMAEKPLRSDSGHIQWKFISRLNEIQYKERLILANRLGSIHIIIKTKL